MTIGMPVFHPQISGHVLLRPGFVLDGPALTRLAELGVFQVWIKFPPLAEVMRFVSPEIAYEHAALTSLIGRALDRVREPHAAELDFPVYADAVRCLVDKLLQDEDAALLISDVCAPESTLALHSSNVCFLSLLMGLKLESYLIEQRPTMIPRRARAVENLGVGALLSDIGVLRLDREVVDRFYATQDDTDEAWRRHVHLGYDLVRGKIEATASVCVLHHHQRYDASGYPHCPASVDPGVVTPPWARRRARSAKPSKGGKNAPGHAVDAGRRAGSEPSARAGSSPSEQMAQAAHGRRGDATHVFARIVGVADTFDRLRNPPGEGLRRGREPARVPMVRALRRVVGMSRAGQLDPTVVRALLHVAPAFAPGTIVRLNNGQQAVVTGFDPLDPCRPSVRHIRYVNAAMELDEQYMGEVYDLRRRTDLWVCEAEGLDISADLFGAEHPGEFDLRAVRTPLDGAGPLDQAA